MNGNLYFSYCNAIYKKITQQKKVAQIFGEQKLWLGVIQSTEKPAEMFDCTFEWENEEFFSGAC